MSAPPPATPRTSSPTDTSSSTTDTRSTDKPTTAKARCSHCEQAPSKYTCPGCGRRTCSVGCAAGHKAATGCAGTAPPARAFVPLAQYSWARLVQDCGFLEHIQRQLPPAPSHRPSPAAKRNFLVNKAALEGVRLALMPDGMSRRKMNTTHYHHKKKCMHWTVELVFRPLDAESGGTEGAGSDGRGGRPCGGHLVHEVSSETALVGVVQRALRQKKLKLTSAARGRYCSLVEPTTDGVVYVLRLEQAPPGVAESTGPRAVHVLESTWRISEALDRTTVVEWPQIELWPREAWAAELAAGRARAVPKPAPPPPVSTRPADSGWPAKRARTEAPDAALDIRHPPEPPLLASLLQYSSSEDEPSI